MPGARQVSGEGESPSASRYIPCTRAPPNAMRTCVPRRGGIDYPERLLVHRIQGDHRHLVPGRCWGRQGPNLPPPREHPQFSLPGQGWPGPGVECDVCTTV